MKFYPSIFNDCLSPIYPGPSSSNTAAPYRLGIMATDMLDGKPVHMYCEMSKNGGYFATFYGLHSDKGFLVGILRKDMLTYDYECSYADAAASGLTYEFDFTDNVPAMPSEAAWLTLTSDTGDKMSIKTVSLGGGEIYIDDLDGIKTYIDGKYFYLLVRVSTKNASAVPTAIACANAALGGCETLTSLDEMAETLLRVGIKLKTLGLNDMGVCYYRMQCDNKAACAGCGK